MVKAVFMDRDGTINLDREGYISDPKELRLYDFAPEAIKRCNELGYKVIIVTNQSGIARGYYSKDQLEEVNGKMVREVMDYGGRIDAIYYSPWHKDGVISPFNKDHEDRKPGIGMYKQADRDFDIAPDKSFMIGDRESDIGFAANAGLRSILVRTGLGETALLNSLRDWTYKPDFVAANLLAAVKLIEFLDKDRNR